MKLYKLIICSVCLGLPTSGNQAHAYTEPRPTVQTRPGVDDLYLQLYGGINKSVNENLPYSEFSSYPWAGGMFLGIGREFHPLWGWRATLRFNHNKSRNVQECESPDTYAWNSLGLFADATFDVTDALVRPHKRGKRFNAKILAGVGASYTFGFPKDISLSYIVPYSNESRLVPAARAGLDLSYKVADRWRVGMELSHTIFADRFNGVKDGAPLDMRTNLKLGVTLLLREKKKSIEPAGPIIYDNRLREIPWLPFLTPEAEDTKLRSIMGRAFLDFPVNETTIYPDYRRNQEELKRMRATIDNAIFDKTISIQRVTLHGYASPESPYANNTRLARGRTQALKTILCRQFQLPDSIVHTSYTPEDWDNLRAFIQSRGNSRRVKGDIWYEHASIVETPSMPSHVLDHLEALLQVIDSPTDPDEKEAILKRIGGGQPYNWLLKYVYPGLRHTDYTIEYEVKHYPVKEARRLIYTHPEALSLEEMYSVARSYDEGTDGWLDALLIAARQYPDDATANLNAACGCVKMRRLTDAKNYLKKAGNLPEAAYLADIIRAMEGKVKWKMENDKVIITENR